LEKYQNQLQNKKRSYKSFTINKKISQREMASTLGISMRTYQDWRLGNAKPQAARAVLQMLGELEDEDMVRVVSRGAAEQATICPAPSEQT
jgi:transcriptional regulator with XRE-family HTH domain